MAPALDALGRKHEAIALAKEFEKTLPGPHKLWFSAWLACLEGDEQQSAAAFDRVPKLTDPEACFGNGCLLAKANLRDRALEFLSLALDGGYACSHALLHDRWLGSVRADARFPSLVNRAQEMSRQARAVFLECGGDKLLDISPPAN